MLYKSIVELSKKSERTQDMKNEKKSKDADFIELEKSEFKNKISIYWKILLIITFLTIVYFFLINGKSFNFLKDVFFINNQSEFSKMTKSSGEIEYLTNSEVQDLFRERDLNYQAIKEQNNDNKNKINDLEIQINNLQKQFNNLSTQNDINFSYESEIELPNKAYLNLLLLKKKLFSNDLINKELEFLKSYFSGNKNIVTLLRFFESIDRVPLNNEGLAAELDSLVQQFNLTSINGSEQIFSDSSWQKVITSKDNFKKNLKNFIDDNFKIRKINQGEDLRDYSDINGDGKIEIANSLMKTKSMLLLNNLEGAKLNIEGISSPLTYDLELFLNKINELLIFNKNFQKLEEEILVSLLKT